MVLWPLLSTLSFNFYLLTLAKSALLSTLSNSSYLRQPPLLFLNFGHEHSPIGSHDPTFPLSASALTSQLRP